MNYIVLIAAFGAIVLLTAWLPLILKKAPLTLPIICVAIGAVAFAPGLGVIAMPNLKQNLPAVERVTELVVILSLMGAGLKIDRPLSWSGWNVTWRLLGFAMPLTIAMLATTAFLLLGLSAGAAVLLAAVLAPTDPVLASDVQVGAPNSGESDETRFALTSEAGLNDGLAFPFVMLAIAMVSSADGVGWVFSWFSTEVVWRIGMGVGAGVLTGKILGWLTFRIPTKTQLAKTGDGMVALGATCLVYGLTELVHGYGFLAVFVMAMNLRSAERGHDYHEALHDFAEQIERLLMMVVLVLFGGALTNAGLLANLSPGIVVFSLVAILAIRPIAAWLSLAGTSMPATERLVVSAYGIRGLGSIYYLAYAVQKTTFDGQNIMWTTVAFVILLSIILHGVTVTPVMSLIDRRRRGGVTEQETAALETKAAE
jgi:sodium/hydrogen antiporter